jgi:hypothetical protein
MGSGVEGDLGDRPGPERSRAALVPSLEEQYSRGGRKEKAGIRVQNSGQPHRRCGGRTAHRNRGGCRPGATGGCDRASREDERGQRLPGGTEGEGDEGNLSSGSYGALFRTSANIYGTRPGGRWGSGQSKGRRVGTGFFREL